MQQCSGLPSGEDMVTIVTATDARLCRLRDCFYTVAMITARPLLNHFISVFHTAQYSLLSDYGDCMLTTQHLMVKDDKVVYSSQMIINTYTM